MNTALDDILTLEEDDDATVLDKALAMQRMINSGTVWIMQGSYGRAAMDFVEAGLCCLGRMSATDYWGNRVPSRDQVQPGTKGSVEYVHAARGKAWADSVSAA